MGQTGGKRLNGARRISAQRRLILWMWGGERSDRDPREFGTAKTPSIHTAAPQGWGWADRSSLRSQST